MKKIVFLPALLLILQSCDQAADEPVSLQQQVVDAVASASDLPAENLILTVEGGTVRVAGSLECQECGGMRTPGEEGTIQQSLGAVIRAVPGVTGVEFDLN